MADLADSIAKLLRDRRPFAYCDVCLAAELDRRHDEIKRAALVLVAQDTGFVRMHRLCYRCGLTLEMTSLRDP